VIAASLVHDLVAFSVQIGLVTIALAVLLKLVPTPPRVRYVCLRLALVACLIAPWLLRAPEIPGVTREAISPVTIPFAASAVATGAGPRPAATGAARGASLPAIPWADVIIGALAAGAAVRGLWLGVGLMRLRGLRRRALILDPPEYEELQWQLGTRAAIAEVTGLGQPATFGVRRPFVLLPKTLASAPATLRRAVVTHELFHVRRRDWLAVLAEEAVRSVLWFHPAILWLTAHIQLAREEIVDELTVRATGDRRTYVEALLAFADTGGLRPAPAFAHRRQLFRRILSVSKEKVMPASRIVTSTAAFLAALAGTSWYASTLFPIVSAAKVDWNSLAESPATTESMIPVPSAAPARASLAGRAFAQVPPPAPRQVTPENPIPRRTRAIDPAWPPQFAREQREVVVNTRVTIDRNGTVNAVDRDGCSAARPGNEESVCRAFFEASAAAIRQWRYDRPVQAPLQFSVMVSFRPGTQPAVTQTGSDWRNYVRETQQSLNVLAENTGGIAVSRTPSQATEEFLRTQLLELTDRYREIERAQRLAIQSLDANHPDMIKVQQELARVNDDMARLREQLARARTAEQGIRESIDGRRENAEAMRAQLQQAEAALQEAVRNQERVEEQALLDARRVAEARYRATLKELESLGSNGAVSSRVSPAQAAGDGRQLRAPSGRTPVRVGGSIAPPRVLEQTRPEYMQEAMAARVEGTVTLEVLVDEQGRVADARAIKSIPLLDRSALDAVRQWRFTPTMVGGEPVPVLLQVEMQFTLK
jgi:TonB family protein